MEKVLKIDEKEALKLYPKASVEMKAIFEATFGKEFFSKKITERVSNLSDISEILGEKLTMPFPFPSSKEEKSINAQYFLFKIASVYNEAWIGDWNNKSEYKWFPYFYKDGSSWVVYFRRWHGVLRCPAGLHFRTKELAEDVVKKFRHIFEDYYMING